MRMNGWRARFRIRMQRWLCGQGEREGGREGGREGWRETTVFTYVLKPMTQFFVFPSSFSPSLPLSLPPSRSRQPSHAVSVPQKSRAQV